MSVKTFDHEMFAPSADKSGVWAAIKSTFAALREGMDMANDYNNLVSQGVAPDVACRRVFERGFNR